jgi:DNA primase
VKPVLIPRDRLDAVLTPRYLAGRAMVLKRYPNGVTGDFFYMKRTPPSAYSACSMPNRI